MENIFRLEKENEAIKDKVIRDIRNLFQQENGYYIIRVGKKILWNKTYIKYESNQDRNKNLSVKKYLNEMKPYLRDIIINLQKSNTWKIQFAIAINFLF